MNFRQNQSILFVEKRTTGSVIYSRRISFVLLDSVKKKSSAIAFKFLITWRIELENLWFDFNVTNTFCLWKTSYKSLYFCHSKIKK